MKALRVTPPYIGIPNLSNDARNWIGLSAGPHLASDTAACYVDFGAEVITGRISRHAREADNEACRGYVRSHPKWLMGPGTIRLIATARCGSDQTLSQPQRGDFGVGIAEFAGDFGAVLAGRGQVAA